MTKDEAREILMAEASRLRGGFGGYGGNSPEAHRIAEAIEVLLDLPVRETPPDLARVWRRFGMGG